MDDFWITKKNKKQNNPLDDFETGVMTPIDPMLPKKKNWADAIYDDF